MGRDEGAALAASGTSEWPGLHLCPQRAQRLQRGHTQGAEPLQANKKLTIKTRIIQKKNQTTLDVDFAIFFPF